MHHGGAPHHVQRPQEHQTGVQGHPAEQNGHQDQSGCDGNTGEITSIMVIRLVMQMPCT